MLLPLRFVTLIFLLLFFFCLFSLGYLLCSSLTAHYDLAFSLLWPVLRVSMGAPIKNYANLRVSPVSHTTVRIDALATKTVMWLQLTHLSQGA